jgi:hypothetical protein
MSIKFDPVTDRLNKSAWIFWVVLWVSLSLGVGQDELILAEHNERIIYDTTELSIIATILLWAAVTLQALRQIYYAHTSPFLVKIGRWLIFSATSILAFRSTYMLILYGGVPSSRAAIIGISLLAVGICFSSLGMMQQSYFEDHPNERWKNNLLGTG